MMTELYGLANSPDAARWSPVLDDAERDPRGPRTDRPRPPRRHKSAWPLRNPPAEVWTYAGVECAIAAGPAQWNGYVRLPEGHPWRYQDYGDLSVEVHGGLTYGPERARRLPEYGIDRPARSARSVGGWVGFDTAHAWDHWPEEELAGLHLAPGMAAVRELFEEQAMHRTGRRIMWTLERLRDEVERLAAQVAVVPVERPVERARRRQLAAALAGRRRRATRRARRDAARRPVTA